jgi:hypothetical protein
MKKTIIFLAFTTFVIFPLFACNSNSAESKNNSNTKVLIDTTNCKTDGVLYYGEYKIINNCWGKGNIQDFSQCIYIKELDNEYSFGFNWYWPNGINNEVKAYPEILFGFKPFDNKSTTTKLPVKISDGKKIIASFSSVTTTFTGIGNTAFDIWITSSPTPTQKDIKREIMIWTKNYGQMPGGSKIASVNIDNVNFDFYKADWNWTYLAFVIKDNIDYKTINIHKFVEYLVNNGYMTNSEYLASVEFGNEVVQGQGSTKITNFKVVVE